MPGLLNPYLTASAPPPSTVATKGGAFNIGAGAATTTVAITNVGFQGKAVIFSWSGVTASGSVAEAADTYSGRGFATGATERFAVGWADEHNVTTTNSSHLNSNVACIAINNTSASADIGRADFQSWDADGFTLVIDTQFTVNLRVQYLVVGGADLTNVKAGSFIGASSTGNQPVTGVGFQGDAVIFLGSPDGSVNTGAVSAYGCVGFAVSAAQQCVLATMTADGLGTSLTRFYGRGGECITQISTSGVGPTHHASFVSWDADGFTVNWTEVNGGRANIYLVLKGGSYAVGDFNARTDTTATPETGVGFTPKALLVASCCAGAGSFDVDNAGNSMSFGIATGPAERFCMGTQASDAQAVTALERAAREDAMYVHVSNAAGLIGYCDLNSMDADGFTFQFDDADDAATIFIGYLAIGD